MPLTARTVLWDVNVRSALQQAWIDSNPGVTGGHEEGGFIVRNMDGNLSVVRWSRGTQATIQVPPHGNCMIGILAIVASFHTHPNTGGDYLQEPSETDRRSILDDPDLKGVEYVGEFIISQSIIYLVTPAGQVREMDDTQAAFAR